MSNRALLLALVAAGAVFPLLPGVPVFWVTLLNNIGLGALVAIGLVVLTGVGGLTSFGQAAFCGFGAFTTAVLTTRYGWSPWATLPVALAITGGAALVLGLLTMRLSGHYLPLGTIAWGLEPLLPVRRAGAVPPPRRHHRHPALQLRRLRPLRQPRHLLRHLGVRDPGRRSPPTICSTPAPAAPSARCAAAPLPPSPSASAPCASS